MPIQNKIVRKQIALPQLQSWSEALAKIMREPDNPATSRTLASGLLGLIPSDQWWLIFFRQNETPILFDYYDASSRPDSYVEGPYLVCPYYNAFLRGAESGCYRVRDLAASNPSTFARYAEYYQKPLGPLDEIGLMFPVDEQTTALLSLARAQSKWKFKAPDIETLKSISQTAQTIIENIWTTAKFQDQASIEDRANRHDRVLSVFNMFGKDVLTEREIEINRLLLKGFCAKEIAPILNITEGTTRNHMKQIYAKLNVSSQAGLCGILIEQLLQEE